MVQIDERQAWIYSLPDQHHISSVDGEHVSLLEPLGNQLVMSKMPSQPLKVHVLILNELLIPYVPSLICIPMLEHPRDPRCCPYCQLEITCHAVKRILCYLQDDQKRTSGYVLCLGTKIISWASKKQKPIAFSSAKAEYIVATDAACEAIGLRRILRDVDQHQETPTNLV
ncbi:UNVERIFIED_CONTAM: hypothetical protein Slati_2197000 [Sesamum latifolium]|uniref:Reverse transcriptase/retrotransposon-derived protein RNase H-like domain-containing protein n=1 Tax=Sesamum latifolium TaxID=2727402 RepID=A0AAW2WTC7_9LAMI